MSSGLPLCELRRPAPRPECVMLGGGVCRLLHDALEDREVGDKALPPSVCDPSGGQRTPPFEGLENLHQPCLLKHLEMAAEIAIGKAAKLLQIGKGETSGMTYQRSQDAQARLLVNDPIESRVGKGRLVVTRRHRCLPTRHAAGRPSRAVRRRRECPSPTAIMLGTARIRSAQWRQRG